MNVGIGPRNTAGQAWMLARALRSRGIPAESFAPEHHRPPMGWPVDRRVPRKHWTLDGWSDYMASFSHLIAWNGLSPIHGSWFSSDPDPRVAVMFRGSDLRRPGYHRRLEPWSPFGKDLLSARLDKRAEAMRQRLHRWAGQVFVATVEMCDYDSRAIWCPIIADPVPERRPLLERPKPLVLHNPTNVQMKGTVEPDSAYDLWQPGPLSRDDMLAAIAQADVVVGGLRLGDYGGTEIQAMAAGRVVVGNISNRVRMRMQMPVPIVQADPHSIREVLQDIAAYPDDYRQIAADGSAFHERFHNGEASVAALRSWLHERTVTA
jgi:hypothetical protein